MSPVAAVQQKTPDEREFRAAGRRQFWLLLAVLALAAVVRLWGLGSQPVLYFDSGVYLGEGAFLASAAQHAASALFSQAPGNPLERVAQATESGVDGHPPDIAKPGHAILLAIAFLLVGKSVLAGALVSAVAGIATVATTYGIGVRAWGPRVALAAAALLAVSGQHLVYSREPLVEADGLLFAMLASLIYLRARGSRGLLAAGILWGLAFSCNNRLSYLPAIFVLAELGRWPGWRGLIRRGVIVGAGCLAPLVLIEVAYLVARQIGRAANTPTVWLDYAQQIVTFTRMNPPDRIRFDEWPTYFVDTALMDGLPVLVLLLLGIGVLVWRLRDRHRSRADLLLAGSLLVPLALYSVYSTGEVRLRHFSLALPWAMLAAALALDWLAARAAGLWSSRFDLRTGLVSGAVAVLGLLALPRIVALDAAPSGMPAVLSSIGDGQVASTNGPVLSFYVGEARTNARLREAFVNVPGDLDALAAQYPTLVVDMQASVFAGDLTDIYARTTPRLVVSNGSDAWFLADLLEHYGVPWGGWNDLLAKWAANRADATQLRVYAMADVIATRNAR
ncbi:MAG: glycosyltransferase family 39 protein [Chloroflexi bacterium]|nr:glycosyltransferase family 39 protein [Chloroflexota bacterium]